MMYTTHQYIVKLKANIANPEFDCVFNPQYEHLYVNNKKNVLYQLPSFRIQKHIEDSNLPLDIITSSKLITFHL